MKNLSVSPIENATRLPSNELDTRLRQAWLLSSRITSTQLASSFLINVGREGLSAFTLDEVIDEIYHQAVKLAKTGRNVDRCLLKRTQHIGNVEKSPCSLARNSVLYSRFALSIREC